MNPVLGILATLGILAVIASPFILFAVSVEAGWTGLGLIGLGVLVWGVVAQYWPVKVKTQRR